MTAPKPIGLHVRLTPEQAATLDRLIADGGDPEATRSRIVRGLIDRASQSPIVHSCTNDAPCPRCSS